MIQNKHLLKLLKCPKIIFNLYDLEMDKIALENKGEYKLDVETQYLVSKRAFDVVCKESTNASWDECLAIFDIIERRKRDYLSIS